MVVPPPRSEACTARAEWRRRLKLAARTFAAGLPPEQRQQAARNARDHALGRLKPWIEPGMKPWRAPATAPPLIVAGYSPLAHELDPRPLMLALAERGAQLALPFVESLSRPIRFLAWTPGEALVEGPFGLSQPKSDAVSVSPDLILTPLVGCDGLGNRLGQGAGHYDRAFQALPDALRLGMSWSVQQVPAKDAPHWPVEPWDMRLHAIVTESQWIDCPPPCPRPVGASLPEFWPSWP